jgi:hypothetical protein
MPATLTLTGTGGPGLSLTAGVFTGVSSFTVDCEKQMIYFTQSGANKEVSIVAAATVTATKSGTTWTLTIS